MSLAKLPRRLYSSSASSLSPSELSSKASLSRSWETQAELQAPSSAASLPAAAAAAALSSQSPSTAASLSSVGQWVSPRQHGMQVQSNLLQGATFTALLEFVIGIGHVQSCVRRVQELMHRQHQLLQQMLRHRQHTEAKLAATHQLPVVKSEEVSQQAHHVKADGAGAPAKLEEQSLEGFQPGHDAQPAGDTAIKSEDANRTGDGRPAALGRRRPPQRLAWHVVSSGVVQIARVGLDNAVLEVRPPPPWSHAISSVQPKSENGAVNTATADDNLDTDMPDVQQPSASAHQPAPMSEPQPFNKVQDSIAQPAPFLTIHMQWKLAAVQSPDQDRHLEPGTMSVPINAALNQSRQGPVFQGPSLGLLSSQGKPASQVLPPPQGMQDAPPRLPPQHGPKPPAGVAVVDEARGDPPAVPSGGQGIPKLRCRIQSEPELPLQVLESFQEMAGKLIGGHHS